MLQFPCCFYFSFIREAKPITLRPYQRSFPCFVFWWVTLPMLRLLWSKAQGCKDIKKTKTWTLLCCYSLNSSHWVFLDEHPYARVSVFLFLFFCIVKFVSFSHKRYWGSQKINLTLMLLVAYLAITKWCKNRKNDWNLGIWVLIWEYSSRAIWWIPTWQGLDGFQRFFPFLCFGQK